MELSVEEMIERNEGYEEDRQHAAQMADGIPDRVENRADLFEQLLKEWKSFLPDSMKPHADQYEHMWVAAWNRLPRESNMI